MSVATIGLYRPKTPENIGSVLRLAGCFGVSLLVIDGVRCPIKRAATDTMNSFARIPIVTGSLRESNPHACVPVAVELVDGASSLYDYVHPDRAFYIFGPEDGSLGKNVTSWCRDVVQIPAGCLNLATAVACVLYDRAAKEHKREEATRG